MTKVERSEEERLVLGTVRVGVLEWRNKPYAFAVLAVGTLISFLFIMSVNNVELVSLTREVNGATVRVTVPRFRNLKDVAFERMVNWEIQETVQRFLDELAGKIAEERPLEKNFPSVEAFVTTEVRYRSRRNGLFSFTLHMYSFTIGAHGSERVVAYSLDLKRCRKIVPAQFLGIERAEELRNAIVEVAQTHFKGLYPDAADYIRTDPHLRDLSRPMYVTPEALVVIYEPYEIAPGDAGTVMLHVKWEQLGFSSVPYGSS